MPIGMWLSSYLPSSLYPGLTHYHYSICQNDLTQCRPSLMQSILLIRNLLHQHPLSYLLWKMLCRTYLHFPLWVHWCSWNRSSIYSCWSLHPYHPWIARFVRCIAGRVYLFLYLLVACCRIDSLILDHLSLVAEDVTKFGSFVVLIRWCLYQCHLIYQSLCHSQLHGSMFLATHCPTLSFSSPSHHAVYFICSWFYKKTLAVLNRKKALEIIYLLCIDVHDDLITWEHWIICLV